MDLKQIADAVIDSVKVYVSQAIKSIDARLDEFDEKIKSIPSGARGESGERGEKGETGLPGNNGLDATVDEAAIIERVLSKVFLSDEFMTKMVEAAAFKVHGMIAAPENGKDGLNGKDADESVIVEKVLAKIVIPQDGKSVTVDDVAPLIETIVSKHVAEIPVPKDGLNGKDADEESIIAKVLEKIPSPKDGKDGTNGKDVDHEIIKTELATLVSGLPKPENGKDADQQVIREMLIEEVAKIPVPENGKSITVDDVTPILEVAVSKWALDFERRAHDVLQTAVDRLPKPKDGEKGDTGNDGFGIETFEQKDARTVVAVYKRGDETIEHEFKFPAVIDRGVFKSGNNYEQGDGVTYGGSFWIAQKDSNDIPGNSDAWRLAVKRGRDGKDAS